MTSNCEAPGALGTYEGLGPKSPQPPQRLSALSPDGCEQGPWEGSSWVLAVVAPSLGEGCWDGLRGRAVMIHCQGLLQGRQHLVGVSG